MKRIFTLFLILALLIVPFPVYADEMTEDFNTVYSKDASAVMGVYFEVPEGFGHSCYMLMFDGNGNYYRVSASETNGYHSQIYLAEGDYYIDLVGVYGDNLNEYPFIYNSGQYIKVTANESINLNFSLKDYDKIDEDISINNGNQNKEETSWESDIDLYPTGIDGVTVDDSGITYFDVVHEGTSNVIVRAFGNAIEDADIVFKVLKTGVLGEAVVALSKDGGQTYIAEAVADDTITVGTSGVTVSFLMKSDKEMLVEGDTFSFKTYENYLVQSSGNISQGYITLFGHPEEKQNILIKILSSGGLGESRFTVSYDNGNSVALQDIIPENGIYELPNNLTLYFSENDYARGLEYTISIAPNKTQISVVPLIIIGGIVVVVAIAIYIFLESKKDHKADYVIRKYTQMKENEYYE